MAKKKGLKREREEKVFNPPHAHPLPRKLVDLTTSLMML